MPAAVNDRPPRKGPIIRYFIPWKGFSSGLGVSEVWASPSSGAAGLPTSVLCDGLTAFDCRSGLAWARARDVTRTMNVAAKTNRAANNEFLRKLCGQTMFKVLSGEEMGNLHMLIPQTPAAKGCRLFATGELNRYTVAAVFTSLIRESFSLLRVLCA